MDFSAPLLKGTLIKRYKRFLADVTLDDGSVVTAHTANSGSMLGCCTPGSEVWLSPANNPERKLKFTWELVRVGDELVGINTSHPNALAAEAILSGAIPELAGYATLKREVKYGKNSRIDVFLTAPDRPDCYVEVKNTTLFRPDGDNQQVALFPDAVTERGTKHLGELSDMVRAGKRAVMLYMVQRSAAGLGRFAVAEDIDPTYAAALRDALAVGVEALCYTCSVTPERLEVAIPLHIRL
ncbi:DNA/RNA nuclease SfsA [Insolitispirillum peregrinum]|uniref:DNA/RNA nuclease SfsA n=1 Tax=Insolitispirillum peregrinum TaxID=80876 RepID=UPI0036141335